MRLIKYLFIVLFLLALLLPTAAKANQLAKQNWIYQLGWCESYWRPEIKILDSNNKYSYGVLQFQMGTWLAYGKWLRADTRNIYSPAMQTLVAERMLDAGLNYHWKTCSAKVTKEFGPYPL